MIVFVYFDYKKVEKYGNNNNNKNNSNRVLHIHLYDFINDMRKYEQKFT